MYPIPEADGKVELDGDQHPVRPGTTVHIPPDTRYRLVNEEGVKMIMVDIPGFRTERDRFD